MTNIHKQDLKWFSEIEKGIGSDRKILPDFSKVKIVPKFLVLNLRIVNLLGIFRFMLYHYKIIF